MVFQSCAHKTGTPGDCPALYPVKAADNPLTRTESGAPRLAPVNPHRRAHGLPLIRALADDTDLTSNTHGTTVRMRWTTPRAQRSTAGDAGGAQDRAGEPTRGDGPGEPSKSPAATTPTVRKANSPSVTTRKCRARWPRRDYLLRHSQLLGLEISICVNYWMIRCELAASRPTSR
jgi:hypothetical protein